MTEAPPRLVILGSSVSALGVVRAARRLGAEVVVADSSRGVAFQGRGVRPLHFESSDDQNVAQRLIEAAGPAAVLIAASDRWLRFIQRVRRAIESASLRILHPAEPVLSTCLSKLAFAEWCVANGLSTPVAARGDDPVGFERCGLPAILRPEETQHDDAQQMLPKAVEVRTSEERDLWLARFAAARTKAVLTQSLLNSNLIQYSVPIARTEVSTLVFVARKERPGPRQCRVGTYFVARPEPEIESLARAVVDRMNFVGIGEVEILQDADSGQVWVIEINPRPWTQFGLAAALGYDFLGHLLGRPNCGPAAQPLHEVAWLDFRNDIYSVFSRREGMWTHGQISVSGYLRSLFKVRAFARFQWSDPWPAIVDFPSLLRRGHTT